MIYEKLLKIQEQGISLAKDGTNPHFKSQYVTLNEVLNKVKKPLNDAGILIVQKPGMTGLETVLVDTEDSSQVVSFVPYTAVTDMQKLGGAITYARRYSLISMLGLDDEDLDAEDSIDRTKSQKKGVVEQDGQPFSI